MKKLLLSLLALASLSASAESTTYKLVTTTDDITNDGTYILVGTKADGTNCYAMGTQATGKTYRSGVSVTISDKTCDIAGKDDISTFSLVNGTTDGTYAIKFSDGKYLSISDASSSSISEADNTSTATDFSFSIDSSTNKVTITNSQTGNYNVIGYNATYYRFSNYKNIGYIYIYKLDTSVTVAAPTFSLEAGTVAKDSTVEISCSTTDAVIYYTTNDDDPTSSSTKYESAITLTESCTLKAIAICDGVASAIASAEYTVVTPVTSLATANALADADVFVMGIDLVVLYDSDNYTYVYDSTNKVYSLIYGTVTDAAAGKVIKSGWSGYMSYNAGLPRLKPDSNLAVSGSETGTIPAVPKKKASEITTDMVHQYVEVENINFTDATPESSAGATTTFTGTSVGEDSATTLTFQNTFKLASQPAGMYNVFCFVATHNSTSTTSRASAGSDLRLFPTGYGISTLGTADIEIESEEAPVYYNLQGVRVENPEHGLFIEVRGGKAVKVVK